MEQTILLTSFMAWRPRQGSNASDDLLQVLVTEGSLPESIHVLRQLPVCAPVATELAIAAIQRVQPQLVVCCGVAGLRSQLSVESRAIAADQTYYTTLDLASLTEDLPHTVISHDAGRFVCNQLYVSVLDYLQQHRGDRPGVFVHVPPLTDHNRAAIVADFRQLLAKLTAMDLKSQPSKRLT